MADTTSPKPTLADAIAAAKARNAERKASRGGVYGNEQPDDAARSDDAPTPAPAYIPHVPPPTHNPFDRIDVSLERPTLSISSQGEEKKGKTHFAMTSPGPIAVIATDAGTEAIATQWQKRGKDIMIFRCPVIKGSAATDADYRSVWTKIEYALNYVIVNHARMGWRTVVCDTATEMWEAKRLAEFGKLTQVMPHRYVEVNMQFKSLINAVCKCPGLNSVWIHTVRKEYKKGSDGKDYWTGKMERAGFNTLPYIVDIPVENFLYKPSRDEAAEGAVPEFGVRVVDSRYHPENLVGEEFRGELCEFSTIAQIAWPETEAEYWA